MLSRILVKKQPGRRWLKYIAALGLLVSTLVVAGIAFAVHDLDFQLDGNVAATCPPSPDTGFCTSSQKDWADMFSMTNTATTQTVSVNTPLTTTNGTFDAATFTRDFRSGSACALDSLSTTFCTSDTTTYATGSKDTLDIHTGWACNFDHNVNSKIDIMNAYSAAFTKTSDGHKLLYFGLEKNKDNGTNDAGFWFLQGDANCDASGGGHPAWDGTHTNGDVLVVAEYSRGGGVGNITAYKWDDTLSPPLAQIANATVGTADCKIRAGDDALCATTNSGAKQFNTDITTPWLTSDATLGVGTTVVPPDFFEGGIDITAAFASSGGGTAPSCFNTFIADTRSSTSLTATLFDYARGTLGECVTTLTTSAAGTASGSIGTGSVSSGTDTATLTITGTPTWGGHLSWYLCGPVSTDACDNTKGVPVTDRDVSQASPASDFVSGTATLTSVGRYCWTAHFEPNTATKNAGIKPIDDNAENECFSVAAVTPTLNTQASCTSTPCVLGVDTISDTATLSGTASRPGSGGGGTPGVYTTINPTTAGSAADGSISWTLYGPSNSSCTTNSKATFSRTVNGDGTYPTAAQTAVSYKPALADGVGAYVFVASYPSDSVNTNAAATTGCSDTKETITLIGSAGISSAQRWLPNDRIVLTTNGGTLNGTLTVTLYKGTFTVTNGTCTPDASATLTGYSKTFTPSGDASGTAYNTDNSTFFVGTKSDGSAGGAAGSYFWLVQYNDQNLTDPKDSCETSTLTITN